MKVLHFLAAIKFSGAEVMLTRASRLFKDNGIELHALDTGAVIGDYASVLESVGYTVHHIPFSKNLRFFAELFRFFKLHQFDVIHNHVERASMWIAATAKIAGCTAIVQTHHSTFTFRGFLRVRRIWTRWLARTFFRVRNIAIGDSVAETERHYLLNPCAIVYNCTDDSKFYKAATFEEILQARKDLKVPTNSFVISSIGSCSEIKQHDLIIKAVKDLKDIGISIFYLHVGDGKMNHFEQNLACELGLGQQIAFLGQQNDVRKYLIASDLYVMPSRYEGFGISALEALKCGIPCLVSDVPGLRDIVKQELNGWLINPVSLAVYLQNIVNDGWCNRLNDVNRSVEHLTMQKSIATLMQVYNQQV